MADTHSTSPNLFVARHLVSLHVVYVTVGAVVRAANSRSKSSGHGVTIYTNLGRVVDILVPQHRKQCNLVSADVLRQKKENVDSTKIIL